MRTRPTSSSSPVSSPLDLSTNSGQASRGRQVHRPVLLHESLAALQIQAGDIVVDATLGGAGHARELTKGLGGNGLFIGFDLDSAAIERAKAALKGADAKVHLVEANFRHIGSELEKLGIKHITKVLFDLGWSSYQLDSGRGFSFKSDEPLRMTYSDSGESLTAETIVNTWSEASLADIIFGFGEERYARRIAKAIATYRRERPIQTARELAEVIYQAVPIGYRKGRIHPATKTFQALRIAVNDELGALEEGLQGAWKMLAPRGRIAVITFHSLEDRIVKRMFAAWEKEGKGVRLTKKPTAPSREEMRENPRARSAKLRVFERHFHESKNSKNKQIRTLDISGEA